MTQLNFFGIYPCPVCRWGQLQSMSLMDAFSCDFCQHIFTAEAETQQIKLPSRQPPLVWRWNGKNWVEAHLEGVEWSWGYWLGAIALVVFPPSLIGLTLYAFPPTPGTPLFWLPYVWTFLAFLAHLGIILWLVIEFYQFPVAVYLRGMRQHLVNR